MSLQGVLPFVFDFLDKKPIEFEISRAQLTTDAGLLPICQFDEKIGLSKQFAAALRDDRSPAVVSHTHMTIHDCGYYVCQLNLKIVSYWNDWWPGPLTIL